jgi:hypothetical protein
VIQARLAVGSRKEIRAAGDTLLARGTPSAAYFMGESHVQRALAYNNTWWLSSSRPAGVGGELVRLALNKASVRLGWNDSPEDLAYDPQRNSVWSLSELAGARHVFDVARASISP